MLDYSVPIYQINIDAANKITTTYGFNGYWARFYPLAFSQALGAAGNIAPGTRVPYSSNFIKAPGNDGVFILENRRDGRVFSFWMAHGAVINAITATNILAGLFSNSMKHIAGAASVSKPFTATKHVSQRGMGIEKRALVITGEELLTGEIRHAAELTVTNTWYCLGSVKNAVKGVDWLPPATRCEFNSTSYPGAERDRTKLVPEGLRIAFQVTPEEREVWLTSKGFTGAFKNFARIIINCWCDYGLVVAETGGHGMGVQTTGMYGPDRSIYESFGIQMNTAAMQEQALKTFANDFRDRAWVVRPAA